MINFYCEKTHRFWFTTALALHLAAAWFTLGFLHPDEQWQILTPLHLKLVNGSLDSLTWDFQYRIRPWFQIFLYYPIGKIFYLLEAGPFSMDIGLRTLTSLLSFGALAWLGHILFKNESKQRQIVWCQFLALTWFLPMFQARASSENFSSAFMFLSIGTLYSAKKSRTFLTAGLLAGLSFLVRYQMGVVALALLAWMILSKLHRLSHLALFCLGVLLCLPLGILVDYWGYGEWTFSPWHYFYQNIVLDKASQWGVMPWYFYFKVAFTKGIPPISIPFLMGFIAFAWHFPRHIISIASLSFLLVHTIIGHKEMRFLIFIYQLTPIFMTFFYRPHWWWKYFWGINGMALIICTFNPLLSYLKFERWLYDNYPQPTVIHVEIEPNGKQLGLNPLYKRPQTHVVGVSDLKKTQGLVLTGHIQQYKVMNDRQECRILHSHYPPWLLQEKYNFFAWNTRSSIWILWKCLP